LGNEKVGRYDTIYDTDLHLKTNTQAVILI